MSRTAATLALAGLTCLLGAGTAAASENESDSEVTDDARVEGSRYVAAGGAAAGDTWLYLTAFVEGGVRLPGRDVWLHARLDRGEGGDFEASGAVTSFVAGVEGRRCGTTGRWCGVLGVDVGFIAGEIVDVEHERSYDLSAPLLMMRGSVELAVTRRVGLRLGLQGRRLAGGEYSSGPGYGADLGVLVRW